MSLINKMLQDLDARGGGGEPALSQQEVKAVPATERDRRPLIVGGAAAGVLVLAAGGWYGWQYWRSHNAPAAAPVPAARVVDNRIPDRPRFQEPPATTSAATPTASGAAAVAPSPAASAPVAERAAPEPVPAKPKPAEHVMAEARREESDMPAMAQQHKAPRAAAATPATGDGVVLRELTPKQMSENSYRRALGHLQEGRVNAALVELDKSVELDPRNEAARQTYVSLLLENKRTDDAIRQLRLALGIDPRQPGLAMVLARLQLERGDPALDTLLKTLPYAGASPDYHAFLAGVLQREQRHAEAAQHYRDALQLSPQNAVWWMGLGISLQADQHLPEAREAYNRARSTGGLTPELRSFVDRKIEQLSR
ncbi:MSHA biogenesis protein MshN [Duganella sacchari]|uniref:MSHA biogenesis protein MshN n=1 Tax=Duganella sacchari TaxID=551987 RepID=A0A1M7R3Y0_9BURK|nr:tetratricopeptide repeat protein [Duganella sacchari]SHN39763.1 MSHA biogenesis protein MshN [Duganella sacchari]